MAPDRSGTAGPATSVAERPGASPAVVETCRQEMARAGLSTRSPEARVSALVAGVLGGAAGAGDVAAVVSHLVGWGPLQELLDRPDVEEIWWNDPSRIYYAVAGATRLSNVVLSDGEAEAMVLRAVTATGRRVDVARPFADTDLPDGSRLHVVIPPVTPRHWAVNIRRYILRPTGLTDLVARDTLTRAAADVLERAVAAGANVVVSGGTNSGKTTLLNTLLSAAPAHRLVTCEEVRELRLPLADWVALQTRDAGVEGTGAVGLRDLVREALRMRPDRIVVGEVRGPEALDLLLAMNCGIPAAATVHARSAGDALDRLIGLPLLAAPNIAAGFVTRTAASCVDVVVHLGVAADGVRRVRQIATVAPGHERPVVGCLFADEGDGLRRGAAPEPGEWSA